MVIEENLPNTVYSYHLMRYRPKKGVFYSDFPNYGFACEFVRRQLFLYAQGVQRYVLNRPSFEKIIVLKPSFEEQEKIGKLFKNIDGTINLHIVELKKLKEIKKACFSKLLVTQE